jgi:hypothetical protein
MVYHAINNEHHRVVFQHMYLVLLKLLLNHFYLKQSMESIHYHLNIDFLDNIPITINNFYQLNFVRKYKPQIHLDYVIQYLLQQYRLYWSFSHQLNKRHLIQEDLEIQLAHYKQLQDQIEKVDMQHPVYLEDEH